MDEAGWDVEPGDEIEPVVQAVGRLLKVCRESAGMSVPELAAALGYGEDMIRKIERGARIPPPGVPGQGRSDPEGAGPSAGLHGRHAQGALSEEGAATGRAGGAVGGDAAVQQPQHPWAVADGGVRASAASHLAPGLLAGRTGTYGHRSDGPEVGLRALARAGVGIRPGRGDAAPPDRGHNGAAPAARTHAGGGEVAVRGAAGDADRPREPPGNGGPYPSAQVRGRYGDGAYRR
ncbi:DNA-binding protein [Streptomyces gancidicus BKS 13-15]|uniref:DNA-binding protein n=1 Tax=Streptomyces gancidicus BKS 13-15 TaxID=1284664 RepID=M3C153_STREZ|nr:DNA-binding protein [Streptomyces gancidicus BKS 13-15]